MSAPTTLTSQMYRGTDFKHKLTINDQGGSAINLTGFTGDKIAYTLQLTAYDSTNQIYKEIGSGIDPPIDPRITATIETMLPARGVFNV